MNTTMDFLIENSEFEKKSTKDFGHKLASSMHITKMSSDKACYKLTVNHPTPHWPF